jgi:coenzyme F420-reducing hydrogenase beta subunit
MSGDDAAASAFRAVVDGGFCSGCGACAFASRGRIGMRFGPDGSWTPEVPAGLAQEELATAGRACPFTGAGPNEDAIAARLYPDLPRHDRIGRHAETWAGAVSEGSWRQQGSSGGMTNWVAAQLLDTGAVDAVVHVGPQPRQGEAPLFAFAISNSVAEVRSRAKSRYYPVEMSRVLAEVAAQPGRRFAFVGVPCFIKAVRLLAEADPAFAGQVGATIAIFCGHLKTARFAEYLAWQAGIAPDALAGIDFRHKLEGRPASDYGFEAVAADGRREMRPMRDVDGGDWGLGYFKLKACDWCDDVVGETADIALGDAWLPGLREDSRGTSVVIVRSKQMCALIEAGRSSGALALSPLTADEVAQSQDGGFRHRREGLAWRLHQARERQTWAPPKRVAPSARIDRQRRRVLDSRVELAATSHLAYARARSAGDLGLFRAEMAPLVAAYRAAGRRSFWDKLMGRIDRWRTALRLG